MVRCEVIFKGRVQGVGFRYTAQEYAQSLGLTGYIRNLGDGSVQMVAEGEEKTVAELIKKLEARFSIREKAVDQAPISAVSSTEFEISY